MPQADCFSLAFLSKASEKKSVPCAFAVKLKVFF